MLERARANLRDATANHAEGRFRIAVTVAYYGAFCAAKAVLAFHREGAKTHKGVNRQFFRVAVAESDFPADTASLLSAMHDQRLSGGVFRIGRGAIPNWTVAHVVSDAPGRGVRHPARGGTDPCGAHRHPDRRSGRATPVRQDDPRPAYRRTRRSGWTEPRLDSCQGDGAELGRPGFRRFRSQISEATHRPVTTTQRHRRGPGGPHPHPNVVAPSATENAKARGSLQVIKSGG